MQICNNIWNSIISSLAMDDQQKNEICFVVATTTVTLYINWIYESVASVANVTTFLKMFLRSNNCRPPTTSGHHRLPRASQTAAEHHRLPQGITTKKVISDDHRGWMPVAVCKIFLSTRSRCGNPRQYEIRLALGSILIGWRMIFL